MAAVDGPLQPGTSLGGFLVLHALGSGGMGVVYAAQQDRPRRTVAIKVLRRGFRHPEILRRFEHEAELLGRLQHPGIAQVYAFSSGRPRPTPAYLVMELVAGSAVHRLRARAISCRSPDRVAPDRSSSPRPFSMRTIAASSIAISSRPTCSSPKAASRRCSTSASRARPGADVQRDHDAHRARAIAGHACLHEPGATARTLRRGRRRSDVYALGVLLYRLLTERLPFDVSDLPWPEAIQRVLEADPLPIGAVNAALGGPLEQHRRARDGARYRQSLPDRRRSRRRSRSDFSTAARRPRTPPPRRPASPPRWSRIDGISTLARIRPDA